MSLNKIKTFKVEIPITRKNYLKTNSAKFKGNLHIVCNKDGIVYDWKICLKEVFVDLNTTRSWFASKTKNFQRRENLFKELELKQEERKSSESHNLVKLNSKQLKKLNDFLNDRNKYDSTIKNIVALLKGNNPSGEAKNPQSAELIIDDDSAFQNFVILLDDLMMKVKTDFSSVALGAEKISYETFAGLNDELHGAFKYMQNKKNLNSWVTYLDGIKKYYAKYNKKIILANNKANRARSQFSKNIDLNIHKFPFMLRSSNQFEKCHIVEFRHLRDQIIELSGKENNDIDKYLNKIKDFENFLPLPNEIHRKFDANYFTYTLDGHIWPLKYEGKKFIDEYVTKRFWKIQSFFLTKKRKEYLNERNSMIHWVD